MHTKIKRAKLFYQQIQPCHSFFFHKLPSLHRSSMVTPSSTPRSSRAVSVTRSVSSHWCVASALYCSADTNIATSTAFSCFENVLTVFEKGFLRKRLRSREQMMWGRDNGRRWYCDGTQCRANCARRK